MKIPPHARLVMIGDSVTDHGRTPVGESMHEGIGRGWGGYVAQVDALFMTAYPERAIRVTNRGTSGNNVRDLAARWQADVIDLKPDWLSIMIGINDVWRQYDSFRGADRAVPIDEYANTLERLVRDTRPLLDGLVLMTPYFMEMNRADAMRKRMDEYGAVVKDIASRYHAVFVDTQAAFDRILTHMHPAGIAWDRIHPNHIGYMVIASAFLTGIGFEWGRLAGK